MTEAEINSAHRERWAGAIARFGSAILVPADVTAALAEQHRQDWLAFYANKPKDDRRLAKVPESEKVLLTGRCHCGCGAEVSATSMFYLGHDGKLRVILREEAAEGDDNAAAELFIRWPKVSHDSILPEQRQRASALVKTINANTSAWLANRLQRRYTLEDAE